MPTYKIRGIDVDFPFEAYDSQLIYMEKVIQSLQEVSFFIYFFIFKRHRFAPNSSLVAVLCNGSVEVFFIFIFL